ncbi:hypothetical protein M5W83_15925 [Paenibacillus thiaminolyticus]|uniref:Uncharacterized protein n=1 Tax=Paenibacillus thiaminolyticus TaxID=49283 RepID=A0ABT4FWU3_PANTH|nr:hypothetical protein [Paenibacillus thiaminolyticus]MCY9535822.1 hypothetical protein [Paenibacillus thiaminolyticus]MCY9605401.1 hypothetical protein [Paenibacillus thiaminolyticus]MCY9608634.1 hypothetical protein [Paenibacillus thiaminolyticus]MCY9613380.1 hypothetical protein [Paenibacillus thiaminolyticus]MCY9619554.1 hypothetical protein [Paenibacillus thiaminolyticus]
MLKDIKPIMFQKSIQDLGISRRRIKELFGDIKTYRSTRVISMSQSLPMIYVIT